MATDHITKKNPDGSTIGQSGEKLGYGGGAPTTADTTTVGDGHNWELGSTTGSKWGTAGTQKMSFYGVTPVTQRALAGQAASVVSATSYISVTSNLAAFCAEVAATLTGLGLWKGTA